MSVTKCVYTHRCAHLSVPNHVQTSERVESCELELKKLDRRLSLLEVIRGTGTTRKGGDWGGGSGGGSGNRDDDRTIGSSDEENNTSHGGFDGTQSTAEESLKASSNSQSKSFYTKSRPVGLDTLNSSASTLSTSRDEETTSTTLTSSDRSAQHLFKGKAYIDVKCRNLLRLGDWLNHGEYVMVLRTASDESSAPTDVSATTSDEFVFRSRTEKVKKITQYAEKAYSVRLRVRKGTRRICWPKTT